jgi:hypothetical protein
MDVCTEMALGWLYTQDWTRWLDGHACPMPPTRVARRRRRMQFAIRADVHERRCHAPRPPALPPCSHVAQYELELFMQLLVGELVRRWDGGRRDVQRRCTVVSPA